MVMRAWLPQFPCLDIAPGPSHYSAILSKTTPNEKYKDTVEMRFLAFAHQPLLTVSISPRVLAVLMTP